MNCETGQIKTFKSDSALEEAMKRATFIPVKEEDMTEKQKREMQVSLNDYRSKLGRLRHRIHTGKIGRNESCPCGSGRKYKRCCGCFQSVKSA